MQQAVAQELGGMADSHRARFLLEHDRMRAAAADLGEDIPALTGEQAQHAVAANGSGPDAGEAARRTDADGEPAAILREPGEPMAQALPTEGPNADVSLPDSSHMVSVDSHT